MSDARLVAEIARRRRPEDPVTGDVAVYGADRRPGRPGRVRHLLRAVADGVPG